MRFVWVGVVGRVLLYMPFPKVGGGDVVRVEEEEDGGCL